MNQVDRYVNAIHLANTIFQMNSDIKTLENALDEQEENLAYLNEKEAELDKLESRNRTLYFVFKETKDNIYQISFTIEECKALVGNRIASLKKQIRDIQQQIIELAYKNTLE